VITSSCNEKKPVEGAPPVPDQKEAAGRTY
jgi:hypothetical protein